MKAKARKSKFLLRRKKRLKLSGKRRKTIRWLKKCSVSSKKSKDSMRTKKLLRMNFKRKCANFYKKKSRKNC